MKKKLTKGCIGITSKYRPFWAGAEGNAVVIETDAFKKSDVIYKALIIEHC